MLHYYAFSNFQSFHEETVVSLLLKRNTAQHGWQVRSKGGERLSTVLAVMGANGAGKTAALKPLSFAAWFITNSFHYPADLPLPISPHASDPSTPTRIELEAEDLEGTLWRYELEATSEGVLLEALYRKRERFNYVFVRTRNEDGGYDVKQQGFDFSAAEARKVRPNASLISTAAQYGVGMAQWLRTLHVVSNVSPILGRRPFAHSLLALSAQMYGEDEGSRQRMVELLSAWDLGLSDVDIDSHDTAQEDGLTRKTWFAQVKHESALGVFKLRMEQESSGTQSAFVLLARLLPVLRDGGLAVLDELDSDLHPHMLEPILDLFANPATNPKQAQLIFTCHTPEVLDLLQKSQVLLVEKTRGCSQGYRADEVKGLRSDDNLRAKYMSGALGGVPRL